MKYSIKSIQQFFFIILTDSGCWSDIIFAEFNLGQYS